MKKSNVFVILSLSIITLFAGCGTGDMDGEIKTGKPEAENTVVSDDILPVCIVTKYTQPLAVNPHSYHYSYFKYDSFNRIIEIENVRSYGTTKTSISYEDDKITVEKIDPDRPDNKEITIYRYNGSTVVIEEEQQEIYMSRLSQININENLQVTSYIELNGPMSSYPAVGYEFDFTYDENGNLSRYVRQPYQPYPQSYERATLYELGHDDKNGIFRNVKTPSWFLVTQIGEIAYLSLYNNCTINRDIESAFGAHYYYEFAYNSAGFPENISRHLVEMSYNELTSYEIYYSESDAPVPAAPPVEPVDPTPAIYDLSARITPEGGPTGNAFIGKTIQSFNPETGEIVVGNILTNLNELAPIKLDIFNGEELLISATVIASDAPHTVNDLVFLIDVNKDENFYYPQKFKYYFLDGYPALNDIEGDKSEAGQLREANAQSRKAKWEEFINYLSEAGRIEE